MAYNDTQNTHDDIELSHDAIQTLSNAEGVVKFFTTLRYDTTERIEQTLQAMHFTSEKLRSEVQRIVRIASHDEGLFEVYLFEVRSLTVALRNEIVQRFRASTSDYLLVLTDTYERLDFVLTERYNQTITTADEVLQQQQLPISNAPTSIRSYTLQVERLKPNDLTLRVLRRFTYTETDGIAQHEKLLNAYIVATWSEPFFNNRALFSDYYLTKRLPEQPEWKDVHETATMQKRTGHSVSSTTTHERNVADTDCPSETKIAPSRPGTTWLCGASWQNTHP